MSDLFLAIIIQIILHPAFWAIIVLVAISIIIGICKTFKKLGHVVTHPSEYKPIPEDEKRRQLLEALKEYISGT
jgi:F0F1-type ATP synthase assembly protein I